MEVNWHNLSWQEVVRKLDSDSEEGLSLKEVDNRKKKFGENTLPEKKPLSKLRIFWHQFKNPFIYILLIAGGVTLFLKDFTDSIVIFAAVIINSLVGFIQENKASESLRELRKAAILEAEVLREGNFKIINAKEIVPGDIIILNPGDKIPADARVIESQHLKVNEMVLTGEWLASEKIEKVLPERTHLIDRENMVFMGCLVESGKGKTIAVTTGLKTEIGKVAQMIKEIPEEKTPYQKKLIHFSSVMGIVIAGICSFIFIEGLIKGKEFIEMFTTSIALAVSAIPEGLPIAMTVILALGMQRVLKKKGLIRKLNSAETLGSTSIICTDKTGTLTEGRMKVNKIIPTEGQRIPLIVKTVVLTAEAFVENPKEPIDKWIIRGRPTDKALLEIGIQYGMIDLKKEMEKDKLSEIPFSPINKFSAVLYKEKTKRFLYVCGAPEVIFQKTQLSEEKKKELEKELQKLTEQGLRVVATAYRETDKSEDIIYEMKSLADLCHDLVFTGLIALSDPIRKEAKKAIELCRQAGIRTIIVTGDHRLTTKAVAQEIGFRVSENNILEGMDLDDLSDEEFQKILDDIYIYSRAEPKHKMRIIQAWQKKNEVIAMTGDGINDAPALKKADIGIALGSGTTVAKEVSDLILLDDSFSVIVTAVEQGRIIVDNIRKVIVYCFSNAFSEVVLVTASLFLGAPLPITAVQILWINLIEDGLPDISLSFEPKEDEIMKFKPRGQNFPLLTKEMKFIIVIIGLTTDFLFLGLFIWLWKQNLNIEYIRTFIFACLAFSTLLYSFSCKSLRKNLWQINPFSNKFLIGSVIFGVLMLLVAIYVPVFQNLLKTVPLGVFEWSIILGLSIIGVILVEASKYYFIVRHQTEN